MGKPIKIKVPLLKKTAEVAEAAVAHLTKQHKKLAEIPIDGKIPIVTGGIKELNVTESGGHVQNGQINIPIEDKVAKKKTMRNVSNK